MTALAEKVADEGLNEAQRRAVEHDAGPLIVLAGPGTGKTRVIAHRAGHLIGARRAEPETLLALTFTVKAAGELRQRLADLVGGVRAERLEARTFHGLCWRLLHRFPDLTGLGPDPQLIDSAVRRRMFREVIEQIGVYGDQRSGGLDALASQAASFVRECNNHAVSPEEAFAFVGVWTERLARRQRSDGTPGDDADLEDQGHALARFRDDVRVFEAYDALRRERGYTSFDDMLIDAVRLLRDAEPARAAVRAQWRHVLVDEFQDVNRAQIEMLRLLCPPERNPDLAVVGDDDQAIYAFRGADERAFDHFSHIWEDHTVVALEENYRSAKPILDAAGAIIERANARFEPGKTLRRAPSLGPDPADAGVLAVDYPKTEPGQEAEVIARMIAEDRARTGRPWREFAVLARSKRHLEDVAAALREESVPHAVIREGDLNDEDAVGDAFAWARLLLEPDAAWAARRLLTKPPFSVPPARVVQWEGEYRAQRSDAERTDRVLSFVEWLDREAHHPAAKRFVQRLRELGEIVGATSAVEAVDAIVTIGEIAHADLSNPRGRAERVEAVIELLSFVRRVQPNLTEPGDLKAFLDHFNDLEKGERCISNYAGEEAIEGSEDDPETDRVRLLTAHAAKGLEFDTVFLVRVYPAQGAFPNTRRDEESPLPAGLVPHEDGRDAKTRRSDEERRLFYVAMTRAERRLVLLSREQGRSSSTHFAQELTLRRGGSLATTGKADRWLARSEAPGQQELFPKTLIERRRIATDAANARRVIRLDAAAALARAEDSKGEKDELRAAIQELTAAARRIASIDEELAAAREPITDLSELFAPIKPPLELSFTTINAYLTCPRCFYLRHVMRLAEPPSDHLVLGNATHATLERYFSLWQAAEQGGGDLPTLETLRAIAEARFDAAVARTPASLRVSRADVIAQAEAAIELHRQLPPGDNILDIEQREVFDFEVDGVTHRIIAKLDRLDQEGAQYRIIDYKTGRARDELVSPQPDDLQLGIYALALQARDPGAQGVAEYWALKGPVRGSIALRDLDLDGVRARIGEATRGMLAGRFPQKCHLPREKGKEPWLGVCAFLGPD